MENRNPLDARMTKILDQLEYAGSERSGITAELAAELEPVVLAKVSEITGTGGSQVEDDNIVWGNI